MAHTEAVTGSDMVLLWLDDHIGQAGNCLELKEKFESHTTLIRLFHDCDACIRFIQAVKERKLFCIIQGKHAERIVPIIEEQTKESMVYIFCLHIVHLRDWAQEQGSIMRGGLFDHEDTLLTKLTGDLAEYAASKAFEYRTKSQANERWAATLAKNFKRFHEEQCTLTYSTDPFSDQETPSETATN